MPPNFLGITAPFCLVLPILKLILLALIISFSNVSPSLSWTFLFLLLINFGHFYRRILLLLIRASLNNTPLLPRTCPLSCSTPPSKPPCYIIGAKDIGLLIRYGHQTSQTKPRLLAALNQSLGPRTLSSLNSANLFFHTMEHPETLWLKSFTSYILSHHSTSSLIWLHDGIWLAPSRSPTTYQNPSLHSSVSARLATFPTSGPSSPRPSSSYIHTAPHASPSAI